MYSVFKGALLSLLKTPQAPPEPPAGDPASVQTFRAAPNFLKYRVVAYLLRQIPSAVIAIVIAVGMFEEAAENHEVGVWLRPLATFAIVSAIGGFFLRYWLIRLDYDLRYYILTDRSLRIRQGAWRIQEATFTFANIQNLTIHQGPLERILGISNVLIETAGGGGTTAGQAGAASMMHKGALRGIENAEEMRDRIMELLKKYRDAGLGDERASHASEVAKTQLTAQGLPPQTIPLLRQVREEARLLAWSTR